MRPFLRYIQLMRTFLPHAINLSHFWHSIDYIKTLIVPTIVALQIGHLLRTAEQVMQHTKCLQGKNKSLKDSSKQTLHVIVILKALFSHFRLTISRFKSVSNGLLAISFSAVFYFPFYHMYGICT